MNMLVFANERGTAGGMSLLGLRLLLGLVLLAGAAGVLTSADALAECAAIWEKLNVRSPELVAKASLSGQLMAGVLLLVGLGTRLAGLLALANYGPAAAIKAETLDFASFWPALLVVLLCAYFVAAGPGLFSFDGAQRKPRAPVPAPSDHNGKRPGIL